MIVILQQRKFTVQSLLKSLLEKNWSRNTLVLYKFTEIKNNNKKSKAVIKPITVITFIFSEYISPGLKQ